MVSRSRRPRLNRVLTPFLARHHCSSQWDTHCANWNCVARFCTGGNAMSLVRKVGFFFELPLQERIDALRSICQETPHPEEEETVAYLESGAVYGAMPGVDEDVLSHAREIIGPTHIQTDGVWAWPQTLSYYVRRYHIALPEEFLAHMRLSHWKCRPRVDASQLILEGEVPMG
jgi:hypothetical protein